MGWLPYWQAHPCSRPAIMAVLSPACLPLSTACEQANEYTYAHEWAHSGLRRPVQGRRPTVWAQSHQETPGGPNALPFLIHPPTPTPVSLLVTPPLPTSHFSIRLRKYTMCTTMYYGVPDPPKNQIDVVALVTPCRHRWFYATS